MDIVVVFAKLWGMEVADSRENKERYLLLESYDGEELFELLLTWKNEYLNDEDADDLCDFFYEKLKTL